MKIISPESFLSRFFKTLHETSVFNSLDSKALHYFISHQPLYFLEKGESVTNLGRSESVRIIILGQLAIDPSKVTQNDESAGFINPGEFVELTDAFVKKESNVLLTAIQDTVIMELTQDDLSNLLKEYPRWAYEVSLILQNQVRKRQLRSAIQDIFKIDQSGLHEKIGKEIEWIHLRSNQMLFNQHDPSDGLYILISGRLNVSMTQLGGEVKKIGEIVPGEPVGEMGFFTNEPRTASINAMRDSILIKFTQESFDNIIIRHPELSTHIINTLIRRLRKAQHSGISSTSAINICIIPTQKSVPVEDFVHQLVAELNTHGPVLILTSNRIEELVGIPDAAQMSLNNPYNVTILNWLIEQESRYKYILFVADHTPSNWTKRCLRNSDQVVSVGNFYDSPEIGEVEHLYYRLKSNKWSPYTRLVLLHPDGNTFPSGTMRWLEKRDLDQWHHIRLNRKQDFGHLARFLSGNAIGLVLGGGGARGFAHIGVIQALKEYNIPIDIVGGTSMGSFIATQYAMGKSYRDMLRLNKWGWIDVKPLKEYTLPVFSLIRGRRIDRSIKKVYRDTQFEDLWLPAFCISSNLSTAEIVIHNKGMVWEAIRASSAIPGIVPPVIQNDNFLVDGSMLNNLPIDIMRQMGGGKIIAIDVSQGKELRPRIKQLPSPWEYITNNLILRKTKTRLPTIFDILARSAILSSNRQLQENKRTADLYIRPPLDDYSLMEFKELNKIAQTGYRYAKEMLDRDKPVF